MTPIEALHEAVMYVGCVDPNKPGAVISRLPKSIREQLAKLTSDDALKLRPIWSK